MVISWYDSWWVRNTDWSISSGWGGPLQAWHHAAVHSESPLLAERPLGLSTFHFPLTASVCVCVFIFCNNTAGSSRDPTPAWFRISLSEWLFPYHLTCFYVCFTSSTLHQAWKLNGMNWFSFLHMNSQTVLCGERSVEVDEVENGGFLSWVTAVTGCRVEAL